MPISKKQFAGFSLTEVLVAITLLMIMIVPAMNALTEGVLASRIHSDQVGAAFKLQNKMEEILARSIDTLHNVAGRQNSSSLVPITYPSAAPSSDMDDSGYSDSNYDVFIFRCSTKNTPNTLSLDNLSTSNSISIFLCIQIKPKGSNIILLQSLKGLT
jgi:Tfp pilus assembly protein PilV